MEILPKMHCVFGNIFLWGVHERQGYNPGGERNKDYNEKIHKSGLDDSWAKAFLAVNSDAQDKEITDQSLYQSIANTEHRRLLKEERDAFYKESVVNINEVSTQVKSAKKAQYGKTDVGVVECDIDVKGTRNDQAFEKIYTMQMVVNYQTNVVSVYEVEDITWE